jgi:3-deoxy-7-phosphoheptulonate synthase
MIQTNNINVQEVTPIIAPQYLKQVFPIPPSGAENVNRFRNEIIDILNGKDKRLLAVVGPCSIHDTVAALEYAKKLKELSDKVQDKILIIRSRYGTSAFLLYYRDRAAYRIRDARPYYTSIPL